VRKFLQTLLALILGLSLGLAITWAAGENPWRVLLLLGKGAFGSKYDAGMTLFYATPLIFTGLSVAVAFHAGLFNVGAEGQLTMGALAAAAAGIVWSKCPGPLGAIVGVLACIGGGALWGFIPGWLRAKRNSHEVINTIMLNFIAAGVASYITLYVLKNPDSQNPETKAIGVGYLLHIFETFDSAPVSVALLLAVAAAIAFYVLIWRTSFGFELRAVGQNESAARMAGIDTARIRILAMTIAGGFAGMVGAAEVLGNAGRFKMNFSPEYGFMGIAVALLGRNGALGILAAALLFGALHKGTTELDLETEHVTRDLSMVLQAVILLCVSAEGLWSWMQRRNPR
jgi:general nucleoside transport system permease protein